MTESTIKEPAEEPILDLESTISGSIDDFTAQLEWPYPTNAITLSLINEIILKEYYKFEDEMIKTIRKKYEISFGALNSTGHFVHNAIDSIIERFSQDDKDYVANLQIKVKIEDDKLNIEVEDNGVGISPEIEPYLYKNRAITSPKKSRPELLGGCFEELYFAKEKVKNVGGEVYHKNKGPNKGAIFGYSMVLKPKGEQE